jgi:hypothetical protein
VLTDDAVDGWRVAGLAVAMARRRPGRPSDIELQAAIEDNGAVLTGMLHKRG